MAGDDNQYVKLPDGSYGAFPSSMKDEEVTAAIQKNYPQTDPLRSGAGMIENAQRQNVASAKNKITSAQPNYSAQMLENSPSGADPHNAGNPNLNAVPESERPALSNRMATIASIATPGASIADEIAGGAKAAPILMKAGRGLIGAGIGSGVGGATGARFGPTGEAIGTIGGGLLGGGMAAGLERNPSTMRVKSLPFGIQRFIPEWMVPGGVPEEELARGAFMDKGYKSAMPPVERPALPGVGAGMPESVAGTRSLVLTPSEAASEDVMQQIAKRRASERGMQFAGGMTPREGRKVPRLPTRMTEEELPGPREKIVFPDEDDEEK